MIFVVEPRRLLSVLVGDTSGILLTIGVRAIVLQVPTCCRFPDIPSI